LPIPAGDHLLGLVSTRKPHPGSGNDSSTLINDRSANASGQLLAG